MKSSILQLSRGYAFGKLVLLVNSLPIASIARTALVCLLWIYITVLNANAQDTHVCQNCELLVDYTITSDTSIHARDVINADINVANDQQIILRAGNSIFLKEGFHASQGSHFYAQSNIFFIASQAKSDAYIDVKWKVNNDYLALPSASEGIIYVQVIDRNTQEELFFQQSYVFDIQQNGQLKGKFRHYVGHESRVDYELKIFREGQGLPIILESTNSTQTTSLLCTGRTAPYYPPTVSVSNNLPDRVEINLESKSDLIAEYQIYRINVAEEDTFLIKTLNQSELAYHDRYVHSQASSLVNGQEYTYRILPYSNLFKRFYDPIHHIGSTVNIATVATDNAEPDLVQISWNDMSAFADAIEITRDDLKLVTLPATSVHYDDIGATFGKTHEYGVWLVKDNKRIVANFDEGGIPANGKISGRVLNQKEGYLLPDVEIKVETEIDGQTIYKTVTTDANGNYRFTDLYYGETANFHLTAKLEGHEFENGSIEISLERGNHVLADINFYDSKVLTPTEEAGFSLETLTIQAMEDLDFIQLDWQYLKPNAEDEVYFKILRKVTGENQAVLVDVLTDNGGSLNQYKDLSGVPGISYDYTLYASIIREGSIAKLEKSQEAIIYPQKRVSTPTALANSDKGRVDLSWQHSSQNFDGFRIYRNDILIAETETKTLNFEDLTGEPLHSYEYNVTAFALRNGQEYESAPGVPQSVTYPSLEKARSPSVSSETDRFRLNWSFPEVDSDYNYDGVNLYRNEVHIGTILKSSASVFYDTDGAPDHTYDYHFKTFKYHSEGWHESEPVSITNKSFPKIPAVTAMSASDGTYTGQVKLEWSYSSNNHEGFVVLRATDTIAWIPRATGSIAHMDIVADLDHEQSHNYHVFAYRHSNQVKHFSDGQSDSGSAAATHGDHALPKPVNFIASDDLARHVFLEWDYPDYIYAGFDIYRDGTLLESLPSGHRIYYDGTAEPDQKHVYQINASYQNSKSLKVGDHGKISSNNTLSGMVISDHNGAGVGGVEITASAVIDHSTWIERTLTDPSGHYSFSGTPTKNGQMITVSASLQNHTFEQSEVQVQINTNQTAYQANFLDYFQPLAVEDGVVALPVDVVASSDLNFQQVDIRWNVQGSNYTGFKVYRGLKEIADISAQHSRFVTDNKGYPGYDYVYRVKAYWDSPFGLKESEFVDDYANYPLIPDVQHLKVVQLPAENAVQITWSHPTDLHDEYIVYRNDEPLHTVQAGESLEYKDDSGMPGQKYKYSVVAKKKTSEGEFSSSAVYNTCVYPNLSQISDLTSVIPDGQHHMRISWQNSSTNIDGFQLIRDQALIAEIDFGADLLSFTDREAKPGPLKYQVVTVKTIEGKTYRSTPVQIETIYPDLIPVHNLFTETDEERGTLTLSWDYQADDIVGYHVYRDDESIATLADKEITTLVDATAKPEAYYNYSVEAFDMRQETQQEAVKVHTGTVQFPKIPKPTLLSSDQQFFGYIPLDWTYTPINNNGFYIYRDDTKIETVGQGSRKYKDIVENLSFADYKLKAFRMIGDETFTSEFSNKVTRYVRKIIPREDIDNFSASNGDYFDKVKLTWEYTGDNEETFEIYRDEERIEKEIQGSDGVYSDDKARPGRQHIYRLISKTDLSKGRVASGFRKSDGKIDGLVYGREDGKGVPGVNISAKASIEGQAYVYTTITNDKGEFELQDIYYAEGSTYEVSAALEHHLFEESNFEALLSHNAPHATVDPFVSLVSYAIEGRVFRKGSDCVLEGLEVELNTFYAGESTPNTSPPEITDTDGHYRFIINPREAGLERYELSIKTEKTVPDQGEEGTATYQFESDTFIFGKSEIIDFPLTKTVNFEETTSRTVDLLVQTSCGPIEGRNEFIVLVRSKDGCLENTYETDNEGKKSITLFPSDYHITVIGVKDPGPQNQAIVEYLMARPLELNQADFDKTESPATLTANLTYHQSPYVEIESFGELLCDSDPESPRVIQQNASEFLSINVYDQPEKQCKVKEGFLVIKNQAAKNYTDTLHFNTEIDGFEKYEFEVGQPLTIAPYTLNLTIEYHTRSGGFQGDKTQKIVVEGERSPDGNDVLVTPDGNNGQMQMPLFILRDPPGDQSYSYIEAGKTFEKSLKVTDFNSGSLGLGIHGHFKMFGRGIKTGLSISAGGGEGESATFNVSTTTTKKIQTAAEIGLGHGEYLKGDQSDLIVGTGISTAYGLAEEIKVEGCEITKRTKLKLVADGLTTEWHYTVFQIEELIEEYKRQIQQIEDSTLTVVDTTQTGVNKKYLTTLKDNWEQMLVYHRQNTVPMCQVCDLSNLPEPFRSAVSQIEEYHRFCENFSNGNNHCDPNELKDFKWTNELFQQYNQLNRFMIDLKDHIDYRYNDGLLIQNGSEALIITENILNNVKLNEEYQELYGPEVKNITFDGGNGGISESTTISRSRSRGYTQKTFFNMSTYAAPVLYGKVTLEKGSPFLSFSEEIFSAELSLEIKGEYNFEFEKDKENAVTETNTVGYVLADDDPGDQFSVTVVKGVDPSHTPYFSLLGGRSSCPPEPGTIFRDAPYISLEYPDSSAANNAQYNLDPDEPAVFPLKLSNNNPFGEPRLYELALGGTSNSGNASVTIQGNPLLVSRPFYIKAGESVYVNVSIERGPGVYSHEDITLTLRSSCDPWENDHSVKLSAYFKRPCSEVSLVSDGNRTVSGGGTADGDNWLLIKADEGQREQLFLKLKGYQPDSMYMKDIYLEYRQKQENHWNVIDTFSVNSLRQFYDANLHTYSEPTYPYVWDITGLDLPDGKYEIRSRTKCEGNEENYSNILNGIIDRTPIQVIGQPEPADRVFSLGDQMAVRFNEPIDCNAFNPDMLNLINASNGNPINFTTACYENEVVIVIPHALLNSLEGESISASLTGIADLYGNELEEAVSWDFKVHYSPVYWFPDSVSIRLYKGEQASVLGKLYNASEASTTFQLTGHETSWLNVSDTGGPLPPSGNEITFSIDTAPLEVGIHNLTMQAIIPGFSNESLALTVNVEATPPEWNPEPEQYSHSASVVANWKWHDPVSAPTSTDTLDIISVWIEGSIRGKANIRKINDQHYRAIIPVAGNIADQGKKLEFIIWDASSGIEYSGYPEMELATPSQPIHFNADQVAGSITAPVVLKVDQAYDRAQYLHLKSGWNWISFNRQPTNMSLNELLGDLNLEDGDLIKTRDQSSIYSNTGGWTSLDGLNELNNEQGYMLRLTHADTLRLTGAPAAISNLNLLPGWNLIGYQPQTAKHPNEALQNLGASDGDVLKSDRQFAQYNQSLGGWHGLDELSPGEGYMINVENPLLFQYNGGTPGNINHSGQALPLYVDATDYEYNMTMLGRLDVGNEVFDLEGMLVMALDGEKYIGSGRVTYYPESDSYLVSMFIYSNEEEAEISFKLIDERNSLIYKLENKVGFTVNQHHGDFDQPYVFKGDIFKETPTVNLAPNPFKDKMSIAYGVVENDSEVTAGVYDLQGNLRVNLIDKRVHKVGIYQVQIRSVQLKQAGLYLLRIKIGEKVFVKKIIYDP